MKSSAFPANHETAKILNFVLTDTVIHCNRDKGLC